MLSMKMQRLEFQWYDYVVFAVTLVLCFGIGLFYGLYGGRQKTIDEYLTGNRRLSPIPAGTSIAMSIMSAIMVLGSTAEVYSYGIQRIMICPGMIAGLLVAYFIYLPMFHKLKLTSLFEYYKLRYRSRAVEVICACIALVRQTFYIGVALYAPAIALQAATGIPHWVIIIVSGSVGIIYTIIGGMKAVVWTDLIQGIILVAGMVVIIIAGTINMGSASDIWDRNLQSGRLNFFVLDPDPTLRMSLWTLTLYGFTGGLGVGIMQTAMQRYCCTKSLKDAKISFIVAMLVMIIIEIVTYGAGPVVFASYDKAGCDPIRAGIVQSTNQLLVHYVMTFIQIPCVGGVLLAVLFAGSLSTISSSISAMATVAWKHIAEHKYSTSPESKKTCITKSMGAVGGGLGLCLAVVVQFFGGNVLQLSSSVVEGFTGPLVGILLLGSFFRCATWQGAVAGASVAFIVNCILSLGNALQTPYIAPLNVSVDQCWQYNISVTEGLQHGNKDDTFVLFRLSFLLFNPIATFLVILVGLPVSLCTDYKKEAETVTSDLVVPTMETLSCCLPSCCKRRFPWIFSQTEGVRDKELPMLDMGRD